MTLGAWAANGARIYQQPKVTHESSSSYRINSGAVYSVADLVLHLVQDTSINQRQRIDVVSILGLCPRWALCIRGFQISEQGMSDQKQEQKAAHLAQLLRLALDEVKTPAFRVRMNLIASERMVKYQAHIRAGFTEAQALELCKS